MVGAGGFASRALKNSPPDCFSPPEGGTGCSHLTLSNHKTKNPPIFGGFFVLVGAGGFEPPKQLCNRFTVCPHWPLGNTPTCSPLSQRVLDYYNKHIRKMQPLFQNFLKFFSRRFIMTEKLQFVLIYGAGFWYNKNR